ncbi:MAG: hypothetical protein ABSC64_00125 [Candidatus Korobacteraceae bacterium]|jgi:hypothetical protein
MQRLARSRRCSRKGSLIARKRRSRIPRTGYLANPASLIGIPRLEPVHVGNKISFGSSGLTALSQTLVEIGLATDADWVAAEKSPSTLVEQVLRRYLADRGQSIIAEHFELSLTLGEAIVDSIYGEPDSSCPGQLFFVLNTESSFALGVGDAITELEATEAGMGQAFYDVLRQSLYRWIRVYDDLDARERIEQMTEWAEGEDDPDSYEIPKLEQDLPPCLKDTQRSDTARPLTSFPVPDVPRLKNLIEAAIELQRVSHSMERPKLDEEWLERERSYHSLDLPLPSVLLYFRPGDAVMACFDDECEHWGQETPEPNLIIPLRADNSSSVRQALAVIETLMQALVLTVRIKSLIESEEKSTCDSVSMSEANSN